MNYKEDLDEWQYQLENMQDSIEFIKRVEKDERKFAELENMRMAAFECCEAIRRLVELRRPEDEARRRIADLKSAQSAQETLL